MKKKDGNNKIIPNNETIIAVFKELDAKGINENVKCERCGSVITYNYITPTYAELNCNCGLYKVDFKFFEAREKYPGKT